MITKDRKKLSKKGNYYRVKTKIWFIKQGYQCEYLETYRRIFTPKGTLMIKKDLFGSDGMAINGKEIVFWNSKFAGDKSKIKEYTQSAKKDFEQYKFPDCVKLQIVIWEERVKNPLIIEL